jgi:hypothetical protein
MARMKMQEEEPVEKIPSYTPLRTKRLQETFSMGKNSPTHYYFDLWFVFLRLSGHFLDFSGEFCLPQFDPEFLVTPESQHNDWLDYKIG